MNRLLFCFLIASFFAGCKPNTGNSNNDGQKATGNNGFLVLRQDVKTATYAYFDEKGSKVLGDYYAAFTDTIRDYGIVAESGFVLIDKKGKILYHIFPFDNGPDKTSEGLYRIIEDGKIGYVDSLTSKLVIKPIYDCAWPFENGKAKVSLNCEKMTDGEHSTWESKEWFYIDKQGNKVK